MPKKGAKKTNRKKETNMTKLFAIERNVRKVVFKSAWKFFGVKDLTDLAFLFIGIIAVFGMSYFVFDALMHYLDIR
jgi:hypothetical protein